MAYGMHSFGFGQRPLGLMVKRLLTINIALYVLEVFLSPHGMYPQMVGPLAKLFGLSGPDILHGMVWQFVTYMFLHGSFMHLLMNMLGLFFLGRELETVLGARRFLYLYLSCGVLGGLGWVILSGSSGATCVGASGAVFGIVGAFAALFPERRVVLFPIPITTSARTLAIVFAVASLLMLRGGAGGIAHAAHLAGGIAGYLYGRHISDAFRHGASSFPRLSLTDIKAWLRRRQYRVIPKTENPVNWAEVDAVLDKVRRFGVNSLTVPEKALLDRASKASRG